MDHVLQQLSELLNRTSIGPWVLDVAGEDIAVINARGEDVTGLAPSKDALPDYQFIIEAHEKLPDLIAYTSRLVDMLIEARICLECGKRMNRQLYCVKCDLEWKVEPT